MPALQAGPFFLGQPSPQQRAQAEAAADSLPFSFPHVGITQAAPPLPKDVAAEGWTLDHNRVQVGRGRGAYRKAQHLLQQWRHFDLGWASTNSPPVKAGANVVVTARTLFSWTCNPLRISFVEERGLRPQQLPPWVGSKRQQGSNQGGSSSSGGGSGSSRSGGGLWGLGGAIGCMQQRQQRPQAVEVVRIPKGRRYAFAHTTLAGHQISGEERFAVAWNHEDDTVWYEIYTLSRPGTWVAAAAHPLLRAFQRKFAADSMAAMQREMLKP